MKLYATVSSERATKGQGGNEYLEIELKVNDRENPIGYIVLDYIDDVKEGRAYCDEWILKFSRDKEDWNIIAQGHTNYQTKGEKQKGERMPCKTGLHDKRFQHCIC